MDWMASIGNGFSIESVKLRLMLSRAPVERNDPACAFPCEDELLECIARLDETTKEHHQFSAHSQL